MRNKVEMFTDRPSIGSVLAELDVPFALARRVLDELAFCMKTGTRLGRIVVAGSTMDDFAWWGHPHSPAYEAMGDFVDELALDDGDIQGLGPGDDDMLNEAHFIGTVSTRLLLPPIVVEPVIGTFFQQLATCVKDGVDVVTPTMWVGLESVIENEVAADPQVLARFLPDMTLHSRQHVFPDRRRADLIFRDGDGNWVVAELKRSGADHLVVEQLARYITMVESTLAEGDETVTGVVLTDGTSTEFLDAVRGRDDMVQLNVRALDLPCCRAQRWTILEKGAEVGWLAVAADGMTVVNGGGPGFPELAYALPLMELPLDWERQRLRPEPLTAS